MFLTVGFYLPFYHSVVELRRNSTKSIRTPGQLLIKQKTRPPLWSWGLSECTHMLLLSENLQRIPLLNELS